MSNNKQSSVEWLENELKERYPLMNSEPLFEQAKAMHKEEVINAHTIGYVIGGGDGDMYEPKQYYNETYGGKQ